MSPLSLLPSGHVSIAIDDFAVGGWQAPPQLEMIETVDKTREDFGRESCAFPGHLGAIKVTEQLVDGDVVQDQSTTVVEGANCGIAAKHLSPLSLDSVSQGRQERDRKKTEELKKKKHSRELSGSDVRKEHVVVALECESTDLAQTAELDVRKEHVLVNHEYKSI